MGAGGVLNKIIVANYYKEYSQAVDLKYFLEI